MRRSVFITGAAQGIGLAIARHFANQGCFVGLFDINRAALDELQASGEFLDACFGFCDVTDEDSVAAALRQFADRSGGKLHVLVNNAGVLAVGPFAQVPQVDHDRIIAVNIGGLTRVAHAAYPYLRDTEDAALVNLCSASSIHGIPGLAVYSASKFYVDGLTQALSLEWEADDIHVTCVKPPIVDTSMGHAALGAFASGGDVELTPDEVAIAVEEAVTGYRTGYVLGLRNQILYRLVRWLPEGAGRWLIGRVLS